MNIDQIMKDILAEFKYKPKHCERMDGTLAKDLRTCTAYQFLTEYAGINIKDEKGEKAHEWYYNDFDLNEMLAKNGLEEEYEKHNELVRLYNDCLAYKEKFN